MENEPIIVALNGALEATKSIAGSSENFDLAVLLYYAEQEPKKVDQRISDLIKTLAKDADLEVFNGRMVVWPSSATRVEYRNLAGWLIRRGTESGSAQAVADLARYVEATEIPGDLTLALSGIKVEESCDLGGGVTLLPWDTLPDSSFKRMVHHQAFEGFGLRWPTAAVVQKEVLTKRHITQQEYQLSKQILKPLDDAKLHDAVLCAGMIGPTAPYALASFLTAPPWVPVNTGGLAMPLPEGWPVGKDWPTTHCAEAARLHIAFLKLSRPQKDLLRLAMQRLNRAMRRSAPVDAAIDLGITLEALFLSDMADERGEPTFRLRIRAARYLRSTQAEREALFGLVGDLYGARSSAVHTGRVPDQVRGRPIGNALEEGYSVAAEAIRRMIVDGSPDWHQVMLG